jgi:heat shock protein HslJ
MKIKLLKTCLLAGALALTAVACSESGTDNTGGTDTAGEEESPMVEVENNATLLGTQWWIEDILAAGVVDRSRTTIAFREDNRVAGNSGCNRYTGGFEMDEKKVSFTPLAGTMMACPEALMSQERSFYQAMDQVTNWEIDPQTRLLHLRNEAGDTIIRASRLAEGEEA